MNFRIRLTREGSMNLAAVAGPAPEAGTDSVWATSADFLHLPGFPAAGQEDQGDFLAQFSEARLERLAIFSADFSADQAEGAERSILSAPRELLPQLQELRLLRAFP